MNQTTHEAPSENGGGHKILIGIVIAIIVGIIIGGWLPNVAAKTDVLGEIFLNSLKMIVVPLVMLSMVVGITGLGDIRNLGPIGGRTVLYYMATTGISVFIGLVLVNVIQPGKNLSHGEERPNLAYTLSGDGNRTVNLTDGVWKRTRYGENYVLSLSEQQVEGEIESITEKSVTVKSWRNRAEGVFHIVSDTGEHLPFRRVNGEVVSAEPDLSGNGKGLEIKLPVAQEVRGKEDRDMGGTLKEVLLGDKSTGKEGMIPRNVFNAMVRMDILPLIFFSLLIGATLSVLGERGRPTIAVISGLNDAVMRLVHWIMVLAPVGIFGLVAGRIGHAGGFKDFLPELMAVGKYSFTVVFGLGVHGLIILPLILLLIARRNPIRYIKGMSTALLNAFSTASSSATLPLTMRAVEEENKVSNRTASFVLPLGATINMDGTALYEAVAAMFIAQVYGIELVPVQQMVIFLTATLAAIGAAGIPEAGLVTMVVVLKAVGLPIEGIALILTIDWLLDRFRTTVNVWGDSVGAGVIESLENRSNSQGAESNA
ncbi:MAG: dicarboxylate/amino acid:cation symporter [Candidatus Poribacteria bacterium]|nr:dicarboxylate/amino acid:cation symporter [Candidatus Poribacteria bacterium]